MKGRDMREALAYLAYENGNLSAARAIGQMRHELEMRGWTFAQNADGKWVATKPIASRAPVAPPPETETPRP